MSEFIQFISSLKDFKENEKIVIDKSKNDLDVLNYYSSLQTKINKKVTVLLKEILDVEKIEKENKDLYTLKESDFLKEINSPSFKKKINQILTEYDKDLKKAMFYSCKVYFLEKYFSKKEVFPSFHKM